MWTLDGKTEEWKTYKERNREEADLVQVQKSFWCFVSHKM